MVHDSICKKRPESSYGNLSRVESKLTDIVHCVDSMHTW